MLEERLMLSNEMLRVSNEMLALANRMIDALDNKNEIAHAYELKGASDILAGWANDFKGAEDENN